MKYLLSAFLLMSTQLFAQSINPGAMGSTVGRLNQFTEQTDGSGTLNQQEQQDQQEQQYLEQTMRDKENWEKQKELEDAKERTAPDEI